MTGEVNNDSRDLDIQTKTALNICNFLRCITGLERMPVCCVNEDGNSHYMGANGTFYFYDYFKKNVFMEEHQDILLSVWGQFI